MAARHTDPRAFARLIMATRATSRARRLLGALGAVRAPVPNVRALTSHRGDPSEISRCSPLNVRMSFFRLDRGLRQSLARSP